jgi:hypothetical protein
LRGRGLNLSDDVSKLREGWVQASETPTQVDLFKQWRRAYEEMSLKIALDEFEERQSVSSRLKRAWGIRKGAGNLKGEPADRSTDKP